MVALHRVINNTPVIIHEHKAARGKRKVSKRPEWAARVFDYIPSGANAAPITGDALCELADLTPSQLTAAIAYIRDNHPELPLISGPQGYQFSINASSVAAYYSARAKAAHTIMRRLYDGAVQPFLKQSGLNSKDAGLIAKQFSRAIEDLADIIS